MRSGSVGERGPVIRRKGWLKKQSDIMRAWRPRYFVLTSSPPRLTYFKHVDDEKARQVIDMRRANIERVTSSKTDLAVFEIRLPGGRRSDTVRLGAVSALEADGWVASMRECVKDEGTRSVAPSPRPSPPPQHAHHHQQQQKAFQRELVRKRERPFGGVVAPDRASMVDKPLNNLLDRCQNLRGWRLDTLENSVRVFRRVPVEQAPLPPSPPPGLWNLLQQSVQRAVFGAPVSGESSAEDETFMVRGTALVDGPPRLVFRILLDLTQRQQWDPLLEGGRVVERLDPRAVFDSHDDAQEKGADVVRLRLRPLWDSGWGRQLVPPRDVVVLRSWRHIEDITFEDDSTSTTTVFAIAHRSVEHTRAPSASDTLSDGYVRGHVAGGGWIVQRTTRSSVDGDASGRSNCCLVTYVANMRPCGWVPHFWSPHSQTSLLQSRLMARVAGLREYVNQVVHVDPRTDLSLLARASIDLASGASKELRWQASREEYDTSVYDEDDGKADAADKEDDDDDELDVDISRLEAMVPYDDNGTELGVEGVERIKEGGLKFTNQKELDKQKGVLQFLLSKMGRNILEGKSLISISLPVRIFEPRSFLQRMTDIWCNGPLYLSKAAIARDPVERLKHVMVFLVSGLHRGCGQMKPFNPILGETYAGTYSDGTAVFCEQISHHPPVSAFELIGPGGIFRYYGRHEYAASFRTNGLIGQQLGPNVVEFADGTRITFNMPFLALRGTLWGDRVLNWTNTLNFVDVKNGIGCDLQFNPDKKTGLSSIYSSPATPTDTVRGTIYRETEDGARVPVSKCEGSWLTQVAFDDVVYWRIRAHGVFVNEPLPEKERLPSDCSFREDLRALAAGDLDGAQDLKEKLEVLQRRDRKLRAEAKTTRHQKTKKKKNENDGNSKR